MFIRDYDDCEQFVAADSAVLREFLHPDKHPLQIGYSLAHAVVAPGEETVPHRLKESSEVYFIVEGRGVMNIDGRSEPVSAGQAVYIPPGAKQFIRNTSGSDLVFLCIVDPAWREEDEEVL